MLISMPTGTSTIFGVFQAISLSQVVGREVRAEANLRPRLIECKCCPRKPRHETRLGQLKIALGPTNTAAPSELD